MQMANMMRNHTTIHVEGACTINDIGNVSTGSSIWYSQGDARNTCLKYWMELNSNDLDELLAILWAINKEAPHNELTIKTKSTYTVNTILEDSKTWELTGYIRVKNKEILRAITASLRNQEGPTYFMQMTNEDANTDYTEAKAWQQKKPKKNYMMNHNWI
jgi:hypothetical protein